MASATAHRIPGFDPPGDSHYGDDEPFSDEERTRAGMKPLDPSKVRSPYDVESPAERKARLKIEYSSKQSTAPGPRSPGGGPQRPQEPRKSPGRPSGAGAMGRKTVAGAQSLVTGNWKGVSPAGLALGFLGWAMALQLIHGGPAELGAWLKAKFVNKVSTTATAASKTTTPPAVPKTATTA